MADDARYLVADIGGTNTRIALGGSAGLRNLRTHANDELQDLPAALGEVVESVGGVREAVLAVAGPVDADGFRLTNRKWSFSRTELAGMLGLERLLIVNDFSAMARSVPALTAGDVVQVGSGHAVPDANVLVCGPGTGFGAAVLVRRGDEVFSLATEAGHMNLGSVRPEEERVFARFAKPERPLSVENVLSGRGLAALHTAASGQELESEGVIAAAVAGEETASATVDLFMQVFGRIVGDLALAFDARGGIYIGGGVGRALQAQFARPPFRRGFETHPPYEERLRVVPVFVIEHLFPGLIGALQIARTEFG